MVAGDAFAAIDIDDPARDAVKAALLAGGER